MRQTNKQSAIAFLKMIIDGHIADAYERYVATNMRHHDPSFAGDARGLRRAMEENQHKYPNKLIEIKQTITEGELVFVLSWIRLSADDKLGYAAMHLFRFHEGEIVEWWQQSQEIPAKSLNKNGPF